MTCPNPIDPAVLADYWLGALPPADEQPVEEHLLTCDSCGDQLRHTIALASALRDLARQGSLVMILSDAFLQRLAADGLRVRQYAPPQGGSIACTVTVDDDLLIGRLTADLSNATRVDLSLCDAQGIEQHRLRDLPFRSDSPAILLQQSITYAKAAPSETLIARLVSLDDTGAEHLIGEYTFNHTRTIS